MHIDLGELAFRSSPKNYYFDAWLALLSWDKPASLLNHWEKKCFKCQLPLQHTHPNRDTIHTIKDKTVSSALKFLKIIVQCKIVQ